MFDCARLQSQTLTVLFSQLPDPHAAKFTTDTLRQAMYETIQSLNEMTEEVGATEVCVQSIIVVMLLVSDSLISRVS